MALLGVLAKMLPPTLAESFDLSSASISRRTPGSTKSSMKTRWRWATAACRTWPRSSGSIIRPPSTSASRQLRQDATQPILNGATAGQRATARWMVTARCDRWCTERRFETADCRRDYTGLTALTFKERFNGHTEATGTAPPFRSTSGLWRTKTLISTSDGLFGGEPQPTRILQGCATCALRRSLRSSRQIRSGRSTREQSSSQNVDTRTASTSVISRRLCHEPVPLHFPIFRRCVFADFLNCRFFDTFELFELLPAFSDLAVVFRIFRVFSCV